MPYLHYIYFFLILHARSYPAWRCLHRSRKVERRHPPGLFWICAYKWLPMEIVPMTREVKGAKSTPVVETSELALL